MELTYTNRDFWFAKGFKAEIGTRLVIFQETPDYRIGKCLESFTTVFRAQATVIMFYVQVMLLRDTLNKRICVMFIIQFKTSIGYNLEDW